MHHFFTIQFSWIHNTAVQYCEFPAFFQLSQAGFIKEKKKKKTERKRKGLIALPHFVFWYVKLSFHGF